MLCFDRANITRWNVKDFFEEKDLGYIHYHKWTGTWVFYQSAYGIRHDNLKIILEKMDKLKKKEGKTLDMFFACLRRH